MSDKLCKDCKHVRRDWVDKIVLRSWKYAECALCYAPSPVDGKLYPKKSGPRFCEVSRAYSGSDCCGPSGQWFDAKPIGERT